MRKTITFLVATFFAVCSFGQTFEGEIVYTNSYKSKMPNITDDQFVSMMGLKQEYYIKDGDYKSVTNGSFLQWQVYINADNKLYTKMANSETILWNDASVQDDSIISVQLNKTAMQILGYECDKLIFVCKSGTQKYYFNSKLSVDTKQFANHKFGNWYDYLLKTNSIPLKEIVENDQFTLESTAAEIKSMQLDKTFFQLPANSKTAKSPY